MLQKVVKIFFYKNRNFFRNFFVIEKISPTFAPSNNTTTFLLSYGVMVTQQILVLLF